LFACCSAVTAMNVQVSYYFHIAAPIPSVNLIVLRLCCVNAKNGEA
jgi:hypothetical protein